MTVEYAQKHGINVKGIILNKYDETSLMQRDNKKQIEAITGIKVLTTVKENDINIDLKEIQPLFKELN